jgi:hypothetical protein
VAYAPEAASAVDQLPPWLNQALALTALLLVIYIAALELLGWLGEDLRLGSVTGPQVAALPSSRSELASSISRSGARHVLLPGSPRSISPAATALR